MSKFQIVIQGYQNCTWKVENMASADIVQMCVDSHNVSVSSKVISKLKLTHCI